MIATPSDEEMTAAQVWHVWLMGVTFVVTVLVGLACGLVFGWLVMFMPGGTLRIATLATLGASLLGLMLVLTSSGFVVTWAAISLAGLLHDGLRSGEEVMLADLRGLGVVLLYGSLVLVVVALVMAVVEFRRRSSIRPAQVFGRLLLRVFRGAVVFGLAQLVISAAGERSSQPWVLALCSLALIGAVLLVLPALVPRLALSSEHSSDRETMRRFAVDHDCKDHHDQTGESL